MDAATIDALLKYQAEGGLSGTDAPMMDQPTSNIGHGYGPLNQKDDKEDASSDGR